jgi:mannose/fructose/N-acetylgalactosamine-specific phosphotransferase system component IIC
VKPAPILATLLLGGIAALDATPVAQTLFSQPLVTATLLGWWWGNLPLALEVGVVLQIIAASTLPVGARTPEDYATGGVIGAGVALALASQQPLRLVYGQDACAFAGASVGMIAAVGGIPLLKWQRRLHEGLARWCETELEGGSARALAQAQTAAVVLAFAVGVAYCALGLGAGWWALRGLVDRESLRFSHAWGAAQPLWLGFGLAQLLNAFVQRRMTRAAVFGAALIGAWLLLMIGSS